MSGPTPPPNEPDQPLFCVHLGNDLPPLPGARVRVAAPGATLEDLLNRLLAAASSNIISTPALSPDLPSMQTSFVALEAASTSFQVATGFGLAPFFWTHAAPLRKGDVARALREAGSMGPNQAFLALYATDARSPLLFTERGIPLRVREAIEVPSGISGPFLVLVVCALSESGEAVAVKGYAQPIYHARRLVPVGSEHERDVLRVLEHLQVALDSHGVEVDIIRPLQPALRRASAVTLSLAVRDQVQPERSISFWVGHSGDEPNATPTDRFHVDRISLSSGAFVSWLERQFASPLSVRVPSWPELRA